jgi:hypothetical protein
LRLLTTARQEAFDGGSRSEDATALLGMPGFTVGLQELIDGEWWLWVETTADRAA